MRSVPRYLWCSLTRRRDLVHQKFTSGALIEKRARGRVGEIVECGAGNLADRPALFVSGHIQVIFVSGHQGKQGNPPSSGLRLAQIITALSGVCAATRFWLPLVAA